MDHSPISIALASSFFHRSATSLARGSSGFGALRRAWMDRRTVLICRAGLHLSAVPGVGKEGREGRGGEGRGREEGRGGRGASVQYISLTQSINAQQEEVHIKRAHHIDTQRNVCCVLCMCGCGCWWVGWTRHTHSPLRISRQILPSLSMLG